MRSTTRWLVLAGVLSVAQAAEIAVTSDPPLPVPNRVTNPGIEQADEQGKPLDWRFTTAKPEIYEVGRVEGGRSGHCLWLKANTDEMSGYWAQDVPVTAGTKQLFKGWWRLAAGKMLIYAHGRITLPDGRRRAIDARDFHGTSRGHWLVPVFLPPDALGGPQPDEWYPFRLEADITEGFEQLALSLGLYFQTGEAWFDDLWAGLARTTLDLTVTAPDGPALKRVVVTPVDGVKPVFDTKDLPPETREVKQTLPDLPTDAVYETVVTLADGQTVRRLYPEGGHE